ncbi:hypothetical protein [Spirochaeta lutea]|uniref:hypothetical protein n=1 Tax=Spirochaeta lutea TaxID=1480694 RepID=UPI00187225F8|nr:hypothetical protein [Spirochaeta lutea]
MNQDQVKEKLLQLDQDVEEFSVIFSGKTSKKVNGLYHPESREIIIHNKNFEDDNSLMYTAVHEFAHHVHFTRSPTPVSNRAHTVEFRSIFHELLSKAEEVGIYANTVSQTPELLELAQRIRDQFVRINGELMKDFGHALMEAEKLCRKHNARFEDFIERVLRMPKQTAATLMKMKAMDLPPDLGYDNMKTLAGIRNTQARIDAIEAFQAGQTPDQVKQALKTREPEKQVDPVKKLEQEKRRIEKTLASLRTRLEELEEQLASYSDYQEQHGQPYEEEPDAVHR